MEPMQNHMPENSGGSVESNHHKKIVTTLLVIVALIIAAVVIKKAIDTKKNARQALENREAAAQDLAQTENELFDIDAAAVKLDSLKEKGVVSTNPDPVLEQQKIDAMNKALNDLAE